MEIDLEKLRKLVEPKFTGDVQRDTRMLLQKNITVLQSHSHPVLGDMDFLKMCTIAGVDLDIALEWRDKKITETFEHLEALDCCVYEGEHAFPIEG